MSVLILRYSRSEKWIMEWPVDLQCRHLIPALNAWAARAWYMTACPIAIQFSGHGSVDDLTAEHGFDSKLRLPLMCLAYFLTFYPLVFIQPGTGRLLVDWCRNLMSVLYCIRMSRDAALVCHAHIVQYTFSTELNSYTGLPDVCQCLALQTIMDNMSKIISQAHQWPT